MTGIKPIPVEIELFQGPNRKPFGRVPLMDVVRKSVAKIIKAELGETKVELALIPLPEDTMYPGAPLMENLIPEFGYVHVKVRDGARLIYQHPHSVVELLADILRSMLKEKNPEVEHWQFRIDVPGMPQHSSMRPTPPVKGSVWVNPSGTEENPVFTIRRLAEEEQPVAALRDFGIEPGESLREAKVKVLLSPALKSDLCETRPLSSDVEEGGFLIGKVFKDKEHPDCHILHILNAPFAEHTGASFIHFTFTGDSFAYLKLDLHQNQPGLRLLGWFHTHLFPATEEMGLSSIDLTLHFGTFTLPWQLAGLINIEGRQRVLRFYVRKGNEMVDCPQWVLNGNS